MPVHYHRIYINVVVDSRAEVELDFCRATSQPTYYNMWSGAAVCANHESQIWYNMRQKKTMGLVKTRRLAAMQKQQRAKAGMKPPVKKFPREIPGKGTKVSATWKYG